VAIEYTKSLLESGDTLVFIKYPGDINVYDPTGSHLKPQTHRVNSKNLLATGSHKFTKLLSDDWKQHLLRKRNGYLNKEALPNGISYVLDLTPPDEGDEAVDLISDLSCSIGIRNWYSSIKRCGVHRKLVGGRDDICRPKGFSAAIEDQIGANATVDILPPVSHDRNSNDDRSSISSSPQHKRSDILNAVKPFDIDESNLQAALRRSKNDQRRREAQGANFPYDPHPDSEDVPVESKEVDEYCPIRHRAGIQALLQVIEGKVPKLDSAPKVWTLIGVAKYFECTHIVVSCIISLRQLSAKC